MRPQYDDDSDTGEEFLQSDSGELSLNDSNNDVIDIEDGEELSGEDLDDNLDDDEIDNEF